MSKIVAHTDGILIRHTISWILPLVIFTKIIFIAGLQVIMKVFPKFMGKSHKSRGYADLVPKTTCL